MANVKLGGSTLMLMCGGNAVSMDDVRGTVTPAPTATHYPVAHETVIDSVIETLGDLGWSVSEQVHALAGVDGARYFGLLKLARNGGDIGKAYGLMNGESAFDWVIGLRNAHDQSFAAQGMLGVNLGICDNLNFSGRGSSVFHFARKHTRFISRDWAGLVSKAFGCMAQAMATETARMEAYKAYALPEGKQGDYVAHDFMVRAIQRRAINPTQLPRVLSEWTRADGSGGFAERAAEFGDDAYNRPTAWKLFNCFTEIEKQSPSLTASPARNSRLTGMMDGLVGLHGAADYVDADAVEV